MCYNNKCSIEIISVTDGEKDTVRTFGRVTEEGGEVTFLYNLGSDECTLTVSEGAARQVRRGEQNISIEFVKGRTTDCVISLGEFSGECELFTREVQFCADNDKYSLSIDYDFCGQHIELKFTAERIIPG